MFKRILNSQTKTITGAAGFLVFSAVFSCFLGIVRDWLLAQTFGAGKELDIYFAAFRIPDLVYNILIAGGFIVAFLPLFSEYFVRDDKEAWKFVNNCLNIFLFFLILLSIIFLIFAVPLMKLIAPGFSGEQLTKAVLLTRIMFLSPILMGLSAIFSGILQYFNRFLVYSLCPIFYNLGIIFGILFLSPRFGVLGVTIGVIIGAFSHFASQIPSAIHCGFRYKPIFNLRDPGIKKVILLMIPRTFAVTGFQLSYMVFTAIASTLSPGSISIYSFSGNLQGLPVGVIGTSFAVAAFPSLTRRLVNGAKKEFVGDLSKTFRQILFLIVPTVFLIFILRSQIVEILYKHGQFTQEAAQLTAASVGLFCLSIFGLSLTPLLSRAFFSFKDTKTPTIAALFFVGINIGLGNYFVRLIQAGSFLNGLLVNYFSLSGIKDIAVLGLPIALSISATFYFIFLMIFLYRKMGNFDLEIILKSFLKILVSSVLMAMGSRYVVGFFAGPVVFQTAIAALVAFIIYVICTILLKSPEMNMILRKFYYAKHP